jgi:hypothetical protein
MSQHNPSLTFRLTVSLLLVALSLILSGITFYYFHASAPIIPLLVGLMGALPLGIIIDDVRSLLKVKKTQQPHQPPKRS